MVTGNEYIFENIDEALKYVLDLEQKTLSSDSYRKIPPSIMRQVPEMFTPPISESWLRRLQCPLIRWTTRCQHGLTIQMRARMT